MSLEDWLLKWLLSEAEAESSLATLPRDERGDVRGEDDGEDETQRQELINRSQMFPRRQETNTQIEVRGCRRGDSIRHKGCEYCVISKGAICNIPVRILG